MKNRNLLTPVLRYAFLPAVFLICSTSFAAQYPGWTVYTSGKDITNLLENGTDIWVGTTGGLVKLDEISGNTTFYNNANSGLPNNYVQSIAIDGSGSKWIGTYLNGFAKFDGVNWTVYNTFTSGLPENNVWSIIIPDSVR